MALALGSLHCVSTVYSTGTYSLCQQQSVRFLTRSYRDCPAISREGENSTLIVRYLYEDESLRICFFFKIKQ
jgi:hypothetical protein